MKKDPEIGSIECKNSVPLSTLICVFLL